MEHERNKFPLQISLICIFSLVVSVAVYMCVFVCVCVYVRGGGEGAFLPSDNKHILIQIGTIFPAALPCFVWQRQRAAKWILPAERGGTVGGGR